MFTTWDDGHASIIAGRFGFILSAAYDGIGRSNGSDSGEDFDISGTVRPVTGYARDQAVR